MPFLTSLCFSIFKTPGLRAPAAHERVYTVSANGSPLADINDIFITVPVGGGEVNHKLESALESMLKR